MVEGGLVKDKFHLKKRGHFIDLDFELLIITHSKLQGLMKCGVAEVCSWLSGEVMSVDRDGQQHGVRI